MHTRIERCICVAAVCLILYLVILTRPAKANTLDMNWTITVQHQSQMAPDIALRIEIYDTYAGTRRWVGGMTNSGGFVLGI